PKHLFYVYGTGNERVSSRGQNALLTAMRLKLVGEMLEPLTAVASLAEGEMGLTNNVARSATQGLKQYYPNEGSTGHDVMLTADAAVDDIKTFLEQLNSPEGVPTLIP
ncbi:MAG: hypothetical protein ACPGQS_08280, partial [Bradymonadia bacterium]